MRNLSWSTGRSRLRVWLGCASGAQYERAPVCTHGEFPARGIGMPGHRLAVASFPPPGPLALYGLLGLQLDPLDESKLAVEACPSSALHLPYSPIAEAADQV